MNPTRIRRADAAPGVRGPEWFGRTPESVACDCDCSLTARGLYAVISLAIEQDRAGSFCPRAFTRTMTDLAFMAGISERQARRLVAELEERGHVARERVRTIAGSPQVIRPTATLRGRALSTRSDPSGCTRSGPSEGPAILDRAPGQICPVDRTLTAGPLLLESSESAESKQTDGCAADVVALSSPTGPEEPDRPGAAHFLGTLAFDLADALGLPGAAKSPTGRTGKAARGAKSRDSVPDAKDCTGRPAQVSRREIEKEHKSR